MPFDLFIIREQTALAHPTTIVIHQYEATNLLQHQPAIFAFFTTLSQLLFTS
jgi:hypothetical protein